MVSNFWKKLTLAIVLFTFLLVFAQAEMTVVYQPSTTPVSIPSQVPIQPVNTGCTPESNCQNLKITLPSEDLQANLCQPFIDSFTIENVGPVTEQYTVQTTSNEKYASLTNEIITLDPKASAQVQVAYQFPCTVSGQKELTYTISTEQSQRKASFKRLVNISDEVSFSVSIENPENTCVSDQSFVQIEVVNANPFSDNFRVVVDAPPFVDVVFPEFEGKETPVIALGPNSKTSLNVWITPSSLADVGTHEISVSATSKISQATQKASTNITIYDCFNFEGFFDQVDDRIYTCGGEEISSSFTVGQMGYGNADVVIESSTDLITIENGSFTLLGQEEREVNFKLSAPENITSRESVTLSAVFRNNTVASTDVTVFIDTKNNCYAVSAVRDRVKVLYDNEYVEYKLQNVGDREGTYQTSLTYAPAYLSLLNDTITLEKGQRGVLVFKIDQEKLLADATEFNNGTTVGLTGDFGIDLIHQNPTVSYSEQSQIVFIDYPLYTRIWESSQELRPCLLVFLSLSLLVIIFGFIGVLRTTQRTYFKSNNVLALTLLLIFVVATVVAYMIFGPPTGVYTKHDLSSNTTTQIKLAEDHKKVIDLDELFFDPDDNIVTYTVESYEVGILSVSQDDEKVTLVPREDWYGNTSIRFSVTDQYNESATSPLINVQILPVEDYTFFELFLLLCAYFNLAVLFLLFVVMYVAFSFKKKLDEQQLTIDQSLPEKEEKKEEPVKTKKAAKKSAKKASKKSTKKSAKKASKKTSKKAK